MSLQDGKAYNESLMPICKGDKLPDRSVPAQWMMYDLWEDMRKCDKTLANEVLEPVFKFMRAQTSHERLNIQGLGRYLQYRQADVGQAYVLPFPSLGCNCDDWNPLDYWLLWCASRWPSISPTPTSLRSLTWRRTAGATSLLSTTSSVLKRSCWLRKPPTKKVVLCVQRCRFLRKKPTSASPPPNKCCTACLDNGSMCIGNWLRRDMRPPMAAVRRSRLIWMESSITWVVMSCGAARRRDITKSRLEECHCTASAWSILDLDVSVFHRFYFTMIIEMLCTILGRIQIV